MTAVSRATLAADAYVRLAASKPLRADRERVVALMGSEAPAWLGEPVTAEADGSLARYAIDMRLRVGSDGSGLTTFRKAAYVDLGRLVRVPTGWEVEIGWRASSAAPLFPVFSGWLTVGTRELSLRGLYAPPGGVLGRAADRLLLHVAANGTARWLLDEIDMVAQEPAAA